MLACQEVSVTGRAHLGTAPRSPTRLPWAWWGGGTPVCPVERSSTCLVPDHVHHQAPPPLPLPSLPTSDRPPSTLHHSCRTVPRPLATATVRPPAASPLPTPEMACPKETPPRRTPPPPAAT